MSPPRLDDFRDGHDLGLVADLEIQDHVHHLVDYGVELVPRDLDAIQAEA